jgi:hypothetical protein
MRTACRTNTRVDPSKEQYLAFLAAAPIRLVLVVRRVEEQAVIVALIPIMLASRRTDALTDPGEEQALAFLSLAPIVFSIPKLRVVHHIVTDTAE